MLHNSDNEEKLNFQKKLYSLFPSQVQDIIATLILVLFLPLGILLHFFYVFPTWFPIMGEAWVIRVTLTSWFIFNLYSNWIFVIKIGPNDKNSLLPNVVKPGFKFCHSCHSNAPPRTYHCPVCNVCVFRRDHHCSFGGVCVGHFNQRYFVAAVLNLLVMTIPLVTYSWSLLKLKFDDGVTFGSFWQLMLPHLAWILGFITMYQFLHVLLFVLTLTVALFALYLVGAQTFGIYKGQTRMEFLLDVHAYQLGFFENLRQSLGSRWPLIFFSCFISSPLPSNGQSFMTRELYNVHTKDL